MALRISQAPQPSVDTPTAVQENFRNPLNSVVSPLDTVLSELPNEHNRVHPDNCSLASGFKLQEEPDIGSSVNNATAAGTGTGAGAARSPLPFEASTTTTARPARNCELTLPPQELIQLPPSHSASEDCSCSFCSTLLKPSQIPVLTQAQYELLSQCDGKDQHILDLLKMGRDLQRQINDRKAISQSTRLASKADYSMELSSLPHAFPDGVHIYNTKESLRDRDKRPYHSWAMTEDVQVMSNRDLNNHRADYPTSPVVNVTVDSYDGGFESDLEEELEREGVDVLDEYCYLDPLQDHGSAVLSQTGSSFSTTSTTSILHDVQVYKARRAHPCMGEHL
ncbi:MAG: hypothetical protein J3Q66DRAFT_445460 [Benniella sp.]|nr:MAG: hypothetical protein J3Q66DRAFT_445460 [Benniella sp.]